MKQAHNLKSAHIINIVTLCIIISGLILLTVVKYRQILPTQQTSIPQQKTSAPNMRQFDFSTLEIADTHDEHQRGLQYRQKLCETCGMLFIFEKPAIQTFWMLNTYISLDIIFIDIYGKIVTIHESTRTHQTEVLYQSTTPVLYVLEVPAGYVKQHNIVIGDILDMKYITQQGKDFVWQTQTSYTGMHTLLLSHSKQKLYTSVEITATL